MATVAHDERGATTIFSKSVTFARNLEKTGWEKPAFRFEQAAYFKWETESSLHCGTIKTGDALGKGDTLSAIHCSESANFSDKGIDAKNAMASIMESCAQNRWTIICHESTAKGKDPFYWPMCEAARDPSSGSTYRLIFLPWFLEENYRMSWSSFRKVLDLTGKQDPGPKFVPTRDEEVLRQRLAAVEVKPHERYWKHNVVLTDTQLIWRRAKIAEMGDVDLFKRYYPSTYQEAFTSSVNCFFRTETIDYYREQGKPETARGYFDDITYKFREAANGHVRVWERPDPLCEYVIGADIGGEKNNSDPSCAYVVEKHSLQVVAMVHGHMEWDHYADTLMSLGYAYNGALLVIENNFNAAVTKRCHRANYVNLYYYQEKERARKASAPSTPGFNTNRKTRPAMLKLLQQLLRDRRVAMPDPFFWTEMENMVWVSSNSINPDRDGTYKAVGGTHDDRIMALALALYLCPQIEFDPDLDIPAHDQSPAYRMFLRLERDRGEGLSPDAFLSLGATHAPK